MTAPAQQHDNVNLEWLNNSKSQVTKNKKQKRPLLLTASSTAASDAVSASLISSVVTAAVGGAPATTGVPALMYPTTGTAIGVFRSSAFTTPAAVARPENAWSIFKDWGVDAGTASADELSDLLRVNNKHCVSERQ